MNITSIFRLLAFAILFASAGIARGQDVQPSSSPVFKGSISRDKMAWSADGTTLWFEADYGGQGYAYDPATGKLSGLNRSPFTLVLTDEQTEFFQASKPTVIKSPYNQNILYTSRLYISCGDECNGQLIMGGEFCDTSDCNIWGVYQPLEIQGNFTARWDSTGNAAIVRIVGAYSSFENWYRVDFGQSYESNSIFIGVLDAYTDDVFAIADYGNRILYSKAIPSSNLRRLMSWTREAYQISDYETDMLQVTSTHTTPIAEGNIVGADFNDEQSNSVYEYDIVYVDTDGLIGYSTYDGRSTILNPEINSSWVNYGLFSPDNRYIAALADNNLDVIASQIET